MLNIDNTGFINALINQFKTKYRIDTTRVYVCGASNGGMMCYRLACELSDKFAAIAPVIANMPLNLMSHCKPSKVVSVMIINGTADPLMPYNGGDVHFFRKTLVKVISTAETVRFWAGNTKKETLFLSLKRGKKETIQKFPVRDMIPEMIMN